jgi:predicted RNA binding protein YcfA (HicA-like mRNA interferase family)
MKVREVIRMLIRDGWFVVTIRGSHRQFRHRSKPGRVTVSGHLGEEMPKGTFLSVLRQARLGQDY